MKKPIILAALAAVVLAGCARNEIYVRSYGQDAVSFGAYSGRTITKAGETYDMNLKALAEYGFGVFATYSGTDVFSVATNDFMYNQLVNSADEGATWTYSPIKYWPNPTGGQAADDQKVSFFAYAPYTDPEAAGADNNYGITGFAIDGDSASDTYGHNFVNYTFAADRPNVDLLWGYKAKSGDPATYTVNTNLTRTTDNVHFTFQHVLSKLGGSQEGTSVPNGLMIKANAQTIKPTDGFGAAGGTKITVSRIVVKNAPAEDPVGTPVVDANGDNVAYANPQTGKLDLYTGEFTPNNANAIEFSQILTSNTAEISADSATADYEITKSIAEPADFETWTDLGDVVGVTETAVNVYKDESKPIILIPGTAPVVDVQVTYTVRTYDVKLGTKKCSEVEQTVWKRITFPTIENNKKYNLLMILGLNDVKLEATVEDWTPGTESSVGLPDNLPTT